MHGTPIGTLPDVMQRCDHCEVRHQAVCGVMDDVQVKKLAQIAHRKKLRAGQTIISDEESADFFANVISGAVKLTKTLHDGRQQIVGLLFAPDFLGRAYSKNNPYTAEAATDVEICTFPHAAFERLVGEYPGLQQRLFQHTLDELDAARDWMLLLGRKTAEEKVASFLHMLARRSLLTGCLRKANPGAAAFELPLTRSDMADYLGLTIETVSRQLTRLKTSNVVRLSTNRLIMVPDLDRLAQAAGLDHHRH
ncbi:Crp/Fnr family transcriptional regulator [Aestuariivirga sp.]|uniref:Crp/Fnr family transcriptional regulator n=1 Tax=Aestuariivirga sp. TaxID=2650926 RepID=UPI0025C3FB50|nr:Crp/Fnr family transcriptional regulator [Aestuariivirga sp.]MCA3555720.1 Crp/Fnr family transcriptional regulator [Aestuariivirga sp.]